MLSDLEAMDPVLRSIKPLREGTYLAATCCISGSNQAGAVEVRAGFVDKPTLTVRTFVLIYTLVFGPQFLRELRARPDDREQSVAAQAE
jgi:hypothetical protein